MKSGDMVKVVNSVSAKLHPPWLGMTGVILRERKLWHAHGRFETWYEVFIDNKVLKMGKDYLELVYEEA